MKDCWFKWKNPERELASWKHVTTLYSLDCGDHDTRALNKLSDCHIYRRNLKKMKVSYAAQVFSHRVSSTMRLVAKSSESMYLKLGEL